MPKYCNFEDCRIRASFGYPDSSPEYCKRHKSDDMVDVLSRKCSYPECRTQPSFNYPGTDLSIFCAKHKKPDMIVTKINKCLMPECSRIAHFNFPSSTGRMYCYHHHEKGMINLDTSRCTEHGCRKRALYNFIGELRPIRCKLHRLDNMINLSSKLCEYSGCKKYAYYNLPGEKEWLYCATHKIDGMVDLKHRRCNLCKVKRVFYGFPGRDPSRCVQHGEIGMISNTRAKCNAEYCSEFATFAVNVIPSLGPRFKRNKLVPIYCSNHKTNDMIDLTLKRCPICNSINYLIDGICIVHKRRSKGNQLDSVSKVLDLAGYTYKTHEKDYIMDFGDLFILVEPIYVEMRDIEYQSISKPVIVIRLNLFSYQDREAEDTDVMKTFNPRATTRARILVKWLKEIGNNPDYYLRDMPETNYKILYLCFKNEPYWGS